ERGKHERELHSVLRNPLKQTERPVDGDAVAAPLARLDAMKQPPELQLSKELAVGVRRRAAHVRDDANGTEQDGLHLRLPVPLDDRPARRRRGANEPVRPAKVREERAFERLRAQTMACGNLGDESRALEAVRIVSAAARCGFEKNVAP